MRAAPYPFNFYANGIASGSQGYGGPYLPGHPLFGSTDLVCGFRLWKRNLLLALWVFSQEPLSGLPAEVIQHTLSFFRNVYFACIRCQKRVWMVIDPRVPVSEYLQQYPRNVCCFFIQRRYDPFGMMGAAPFGALLGLRRPEDRGPPFDLQQAYIGNHEGLQQAVDGLELPVAYREMLRVQPAFQMPNGRNGIRVEGGEPFILPLGVNVNEDANGLFIDDLANAIQAQRGADDIVLNWDVRADDPN